MPYSRGKPQKTSARRPSDEGAVQPVIVSNGVPFLQMRSVGSHSTSGREKEGNKERTGWTLERRKMPISKGNIMFNEIVLFAVNN